MRRPEKPKDVRELIEKEDFVKLFKLLDDKEIMAFVAKCNKEYVHWDKLKYKQTPNNIDPKSIWVLLKFLRKNQYKFIKFGKWKFKYVLLDEFQKKLHVLDKSTAGRLGSSLDSLNMSSRDRYVISSLMEEAIASSQLEGAATTRKVAKELLRFRKKPRTYSEQMIVNGYRTMQKIVKMKEQVITPDMILELHRSITEGTLKDHRHEGRFRDNNEVVVGDSVDPDNILHMPPDYKQIPQLIEEFCKFANEDNGEFIHPIIKGIILHFLIGFIHPFEDGNGRTARTIFYWYVLSRGYWLFEVMAISRIILKNKTDYGLSYLYTETDEDDLTYFINFNLSAIETALDDINAYIIIKQKEQAEAMRLIHSIKGLNLRQAEILKAFIKDPEKVFVINEVISTYGVAYDTARNDLLYLTQLGYLEKIKVQNKFVFKLAKNKIIPS